MPQTKVAVEAASYIADVGGSLCLKGSFRVQRHPLVPYSRGPCLRVLNPCGCPPPSDPSSLSVEGGAVCRRVRGSPAPGEALVVTPLSPPQPPRRKRQATRGATDAALRRITFRLLDRAGVAGRGSAQASIDFSGHDGHLPPLRRGKDEAEFIRPNHMPNAGSWNWDGSRVSANADRELKRGVVWSAGSAAE
jgi:hypothetical protein